MYDHLAICQCRLVLRLVGPLGTLATRWTQPRSEHLLQKSSEGWVSMTYLGFSFLLWLSHPDAQDYKFRVDYIIRYATLLYSNPKISTLENRDSVGVE